MQTVKIINNDRLKISENQIKAKLAINGMNQGSVASVCGYTLPYVNMVIKGKRYNKKIMEFLLTLPMIGIHDGKRMEKKGKKNARKS